MQHSPLMDVESGVNRLESRQYLASMGSTDRNNPDDTPLDEAVQLIRKFKQDSEQSELRVKAMRWWKKCDRFVEGDQWSEEVAKQLKPWQAKLVINKLYKIREKWTSLLLANIPKAEFIPRDPAHVLAAEALDGYFEHEWERNKWTTTIGVVLKQAITHGIGWLKIYWDIHGDSGRGTVRLEPVSNYDLFLDESAVIRDGKLVCKSAVHQFELTRNQILSIYEEDPGGQIPSSADQVIAQRGKKKTQFETYVDDLNIGESVRGRAGGTSGAGKTEAHPDRAQKKDTYTVNECLYFDDSRVEGPEVDNAVGDIPPLKYPTGRIMTEANGVLLYDEPNELGFNMYVPFCLSPDIERIYNPSLIYHCISPQEELNKRRSQIADHASMTANPVLVIKQTANVDQNFVPHPGATVVSMDTTAPDGGLYYLQAPPMSPEVVQSTVMSDQTINEVSGLEEIQRSTMPNDLESGVGLDLLQQASETVPRMYTMFLDDSVRTTCENIASLFLDFTKSERKYRFLDTRALEMGFASFNPNEILLPSREQAVEVVQQEIAIFEGQIQQAHLEMTEAELVQFLPYVAQEIANREREIEWIWNLPASDLISFDVRLKVGTREMTKLSQQSLSLQMHEIDAITTPRLMQDLEYHNWLMAWQEKQQELQERAEVEAQMMEEQIEIEREIDEDEHEQDLEIEREKGRVRIKEAEIRARASQKRATQSTSK